MNISFSGTHFQGRYKAQEKIHQMITNPKNQAVTLGLSSAVGGGYTLAGQGTLLAHGFAPDTSGLLAGSFNSGVGLYNIKQGGGLKQLKKAGENDIQ
jgi:hypothetical protein